MDFLLTIFFLLSSLLGAAMGNHNQTVDKPEPKPVIIPYLTDGLSPALFKYLPHTWGDWKGWASGWIPKPCRDAAVKHGFNPWEMEVYSVKYTDCDEPWTICRHYKDDSSIAKMVEVNLWQHSHRHAGICCHPDHASRPWGAAGLTYMSEGVPAIQLLYGWFVESVLSHEISHILDPQVVKEHHGKNGRFSDGDWWKGNYSLDAATVSAYALSDWAENFAEASISAVYNLAVPGGIANVTVDAELLTCANQVSHVVSTYTNAVGDIIKPRSKPKCTKRWPNHRVVPVDDKRVPPYPAPDVRIKAKNITKIDNFGEEAVVTCNLPHSRKPGNSVLEFVVVSGIVIAVRIYEMGRQLEQELCDEQSKVNFKIGH
ncbi:hypothetical protein PG996_013295 [Apiospora saccharicola]|uniref:Uncharacterized protein n=1 Tax=Apiospora saccharicola TaxID=335842 RepID=A0ABR1U518_9PEZI